MSRRLQIVLPDEEYLAVARAARARKIPLARLVRESLRKTLSGERERPADERIAAVLRFARFSGPTGDIETILEDVESGRSLT